MGIAYNTSLVRSGLKSMFDTSNIKSYSGSGTAWVDIQRRLTFSDTTFVGAGSESWMGSESTELTISIILEKKNTVVGYAEHPVSKWSGTADASFVLYHFGTTGPQNLLLWYANRGGTWNAISGGFTGVDTYAMTLQYNDSTGGQLWINGNKVGGRTGAGARANSTAELKIYGPTGTADSTVKVFQAWNRELSDLEIKQNFEAIRGRYGL